MTYSHNDIFAQIPSEARDGAWRTVLRSECTTFCLSETPADSAAGGLGFIQHPNLGPEIVGLAFVHQFHCVVSALLTFPILSPFCWHSTLGQTSPRLLLCSEWHRDSSYHPPYQALLRVPPPIHHVPRRHKLEISRGRRRDGEGRDLRL